MRSMGGGFILHLSRGAGFFVCAIALLLLCSAATSAAFYLPDSGLIKCYQSVSPYSEIACAGTGQDGAYTLNPMSYTDNGNGTVTDNNTGLIWQKQDDGNMYNEYQASGAYDPTYNPSSQNVCGALAIGGWSDWRLPSKKELVTIIDYSTANPGPTINTTVFSNTKSDHYWSSTDVARLGSGYAWFVNFSSAGVGEYYKYSTKYVRCVRGAQVIQSLVNHGDGTVSDNRTGLMWNQLMPVSQTWGAALAYCEGLVTGGYSDWRLPNVKELESVTDDTHYNPAINTNFFPYASASYYWSSTSGVGSYSYGAAYADFYDGFIYGDAKTKSYSAICVRGGNDINNPTQYPVTANAAGNGSGSVSSSPAGISYSYPTANTGTLPGINQGTSVTLTATAATSSTVAWNDCVASGGAPGGTTTAATCTFSSLSAAKTVTATFTLNQNNITVSASGVNGGTISDGGVISAMWNGSNLSGTTTRPVNYGSGPYTIAATANTGVNVTWSGDCNAMSGNGTGTATCTINSGINAAKNVTATFVSNRYAITVTGAGINGGTMTSGAIINANWNGTSTGGDNTETVNYGAGPYTISATANAGEYVTWTGDCDGTSSNGSATATCTINSGISSAKNVIATFDANVRRFASGTAGYYESMQDAYDHAADGDSIQAKAMTFSGDLNFNNPMVSVKVQGGYDPGFAGNLGYSTIGGSLTISNGAATVENIILQ